jgi:hypothetical protein
MFRGRFLSCRKVIPVGPGAFCLKVRSDFLSSVVVMGGKVRGYNLERSPVC